MEKKGSGHVEMIMAFSLFFAFVFFIVMFVNPVQTRGLSNSVLESLHNQYREMTYTDYTRFFLKADWEDKTVTDENGKNNCFFVSPPQAIFNYDISKSGSVVLNLNEEAVTHDFDGTKLEMINSPYEEPHDIFYYVILSPEFVKKDGNYNNCELATNFSIGGFDEKQVISYKKSKELEALYYLNYSEAKAQLLIPQSYDFTITSPSINMTRNVPEQGEVVSLEYLEEIVFPDGSLKTESFLVMVW